jgi:2-oxoisovalerate dehydrogenase E2 component (dihydrolipoyl transacylase)
MTIFKLPDLGEGLPDAEIREWYIKEGDEVKLDQPLVSMETAKAVVDIPSPFAGHIAKLHGAAGDVVETGAPLIEFTIQNAEKVTPAASSTDSGTVVGVIETTDTLLEEAPTGIAVKPRTSTQIKATPAIRALANKLKVDLTQVTGTGARGTITADDVTKAVAPASTASPVGEPLHSARRIMAQQMSKSHAEVVPVTLIEDVDLHKWPENTDVTARLIRAIVAAAKAEPMLNAHFYGESSSVKKFDEVNIGIAVDTKAGLYVPVIKSADKKSATEVRETLNAFKQKALAQSFSPEDLKNATITLSNFGTITGRYASPIIVPPTVAIIGIGKSRPQVVAENGTVAIHNIMPISLTFDHRAATGGEAARFLAAFINEIEKER